MINGLRELERRIQEVDKEPTYWQKTEDTYADLMQLIIVMERITSSGSPLAPEPFSCKSAKEADDAIKKSRRLAQLEKVMPEIVVGPLQLSAQYWVGTGKSDCLAENQGILHESLFQNIANISSLKPSAKPFCVGLFTSTAILKTYGMWQMYLECGDKSELFRRPWHIWSLDPHEKIRIYEIKSAEDWMKLVRTYPEEEKGLLYPDWKTIAHHFDAIHITLRAIVAIQGIHFSTGKGLIAPSYWDVETTLWLRWCFKTINLVKIIQ